MMQRTLTLASGLRCHLYHQPDAREAAALVQVGAGSLHEPDRWPGLAHLLEHLLFCDSARFSGSQRLMPWVQQQGGEVNATTQLSRSAWFFQLPAAALEGGVTRLADMLIAPNLAPDAIRQECAVIDAEYQLLQSHSETLSEAALLHALGGRFRRFRAGSRAAFGDNVTELQRALRHFHQTRFTANSLELWLSGPQSLDELATLAAAFDRLPGGEVPALPVVPRQPGSHALAQLELPGENAFWLTLLTPFDRTLSDSVTLLRSYWLDEAEGGLLHQLRSEGACDTLQVSWLWQDTRHALLTLRFSAAKISPAQARHIEQRVWQHLQAVQHNTQRQHQHYLQLAQRDFRAETPLRQLRLRAAAEAPAADLPPDLVLAIRQLTQAGRLRLLTRQPLSDALTCITQGFTLRCSSSVLCGDLPAAVRWQFPPRALQAAAAGFCGSAAALPQALPVEPAETLLLRPACYQPLADHAGVACQRRLRPLLAELRHLGGRGVWQQQQGIWQLLLDIPADAAVAWQLLPAITAQLSAADEAGDPPEPATIVIRQLLQTLPFQLLYPAAVRGWQAAWCGHDRHLNHCAAQSLASLRQQIAPSSPPPLRRGITPVACQGRDQALLLFIPLTTPDDISLAALQALGLFLAPRFFQRLRVDQQIGYVVTARYERCADVDGLLFALQSPDIDWVRLLAHCRRFLLDMKTALSECDAEMLHAWQQTLRERCQPYANRQVAQDLLRREAGGAILTPEAVSALTLPRMQQLFRRLVRQRRRWRLLINRH
jgi:coenzyme PQQ biosynthesis probable peptidase PqqF